MGLNKKEEEILKQIELGLSKDDPTELSTNETFFETFQRVRRAWRYLTRNGDLQDQLSKTKLISDGETIYSVEENEVFDALKQGQLAFFETIDFVAKEVEEDISKFELDKERFLNLLTRVEDDIQSQQLQA